MQPKRDYRIICIRRGVWLILNPKGVEVEACTSPEAALGAIGRWRAGRQRTTVAARRLGVPVVADAPARMRDTGGPGSGVTGTGRRYSAVSASSAFPPADDGRQGSC